MDDVFSIWNIAEHPTTIKSSMYRYACDGFSPENARVIMRWNEFGAIFNPYGSRVYRL
ncbi:uncharacterized protein isoform X2 [Musca autumnalis]|uniref:uncharacterized protein isoform X2 n=1 Tax=Musca autumnalis TaxID=221902 RepID=UPI003CF60397